MVDTLKTISTKITVQTQPAGRATVKNDAGGYGFAVDDVNRLRRFLILGVEGGTYYVKAPELARDNAEVVVRLAKSNPTVLVDIIVEISTAGRAPKPNPAIFALAVAASEADEAGRAYALAQLSKVCRTATHLFLFLNYVSQFRGWGATLKRAVAKWYTDKPAEKVAYQLLKYRQREGYTHNRALRLSRPKPPSDAHDALFEYVLIPSAHKGENGEVSTAFRHKLAERGITPGLSPHLDTQPRWDVMPELVSEFREVQDAAPARAAELITSGHGLSWEMLPDRLVNEPLVWEAMLDKGVPQTALIRQLPRLTKLGLTKGRTGALIAKQLVDVEQLKRGRVHPINMLVAQRTYASGQSARGDGTWSPTPVIIDALHDGFYAAYGAVEPSGARMLVASDTSSSMTYSAVGGLPLQALEVAGVLALVIGNTEQDVTQVGFTTQAFPLTISKRQRLDDVMNYMRRQPNGGTDIAAPILWALQNKIEFDVMVSITDDQTWAGGMHVFQALRMYREKINPNARLVSCATTPTSSQVIDPDDKGCLGVAGFDTAVPSMITEFSAGRL